MARILLIEDNHAVRNVMRLVLSTAGHSVTEACNGAEGLKCFACDGADLVITDIVMPETEGLEVLMELRQARPRARIIAISGGIRENPMQVLEVARIMGATKVLAKPFSNASLLAAVNEVLAVGSTGVA